MWKWKIVVIMCLCIITNGIDAGIVQIEAEPRRSTITVYALYIPGLLSMDLKGPFADLIREIGRRANLDIIIKIVPPKMQRAAFKNKKIDIIFPMVESSFNSESEYYRSSSFYLKKYFVFTLKGTPFAKTIPDLEKTQTVGLTLGYSYPKKLLSDPKINFEYSQSDDQNMKKLYLQRITAFIVEELSGLAAIRNTNMENKIQYDPDTPLFTEEVFFAFQREEKWLPVRNKISQAINEMKQDGSLGKILRPITHLENQSK